jgi:hypothetical protein
MPMWGGSWGGAWGYGWVFPLLGVAAMVVMAFFCMRRMGGMPGCGCGPQPGRPAATEVEDLRREVRGLREEIHEPQRSGQGRA